MDPTTGQIIIGTVLAAVLTAAGHFLTGAGKFYEGLAKYTEARKLPARKPERRNKDQ